MEESHGQRQDHYEHYRAVAIRHEKKRKNGWRGCLYEKHHGSAASTVSSTGSGGSTENFAGRLAQKTFMASRIELKGWGCWRNIRGTGITLDEAKELISVTKARIKQDDLNVFDCDLTDRDQGNFDTRMMVFLWFKEVVTPMVCKRVRLDFQHDLTNQPLPLKRTNVRATLELDPVKRPWNKAQAIFIGVVREYGNMPDSRVKLSTSDGWTRGCACRYQHPGEGTAIPIPIASITIGTTWELNREKFQCFAPHVDVEVSQTFFE